MERDIPPEIKKHIEDQIEAYPLTQKDREQWGGKLKMFAEYGYRLAELPESTATVDKAVKVIGDIDKVWKEADVVLTELKKDPLHITKVHKMGKDEETTYNTGFYHGYYAATEKVSLSLPKGECLPKGEFLTCPHCEAIGSFEIATESNKLNDNDDFEDLKLYQIITCKSCGDNFNWSSPIPIKEIEGMGHKDGNTDEAAVASHSSGVGNSIEQDEVKKVLSALKEQYGVSESMVASIKKRLW